MDFQQLGNGQLGVNAGRVVLRMSEKLLNVPDIGPDPRIIAGCGYGEAVAGGSKLARERSKEMFGERGEMEWKQVARDYRKLLFSEGEQKPVR